jgi:hypothetical protein
VNYTKNRRPIQCSVEGCGADAHCREMCGLHYARSMKSNALKKQVKPEEQTHFAKCKRKHCSQCEALEQTAVHIETVDREPYEYAGDEAALIAEFGE